MLSVGHRRRGVTGDGSGGLGGPEAVGTAVSAEDVLPVRGLRCRPGYWGAPAVVCRRTQSWAPKDVLDGAVVPVGRTLFSKQPMKCIVSHSGVDMNV